MARSLFRQLTQISGSSTYDDTLTMVQAENDGSSLEKDLNYLRTQFKVIAGGGGNWFDVPANTLTGLNDAIVANDGDISDLGDEDGYIQTFIGKAAGSDLPAYSSNNYVANDDSLETAIGKLDAALDVTAPDKAVEDVVSVINAESPHTLPGGLDYTPDPNYDGENMDVYYNGQLLAVDSGSVSRDYEETSTTSITFHFTVKPNSNLTYIIRQ